MVSNMDRGNPNFINANVEISTIEVSQTEAANLLNVSRESVVSAKNSRSRLGRINKQG